MTCVSTIFALISQRVEKEIAAKSTEHDLIKLTLNEFMAIHFVHFAFTLPEGALTTEPSEPRSVQRSLPHVLLDCDTINKVMQRNNTVYEPKFKCKASAPAGSTANQASIPSFWVVKPIDPPG